MSRRGRVLGLAALWVVQVSGRNVICAFLVLEKRHHFLLHPTGPTYLPWHSEQKKANERLKSEHRGKTVEAYFKRHRTFLILTWNFLHGVLVTSGRGGVKGRGGGLWGVSCCSFLSEWQTGTSYNSADLKSLTRDGMLMKFHTERNRQGCSKATLDFLHPPEAVMMWLSPQLFGPEMNQNHFIHLFMHRPFYFIH